MIKIVKVTKENGTVFTVAINGRPYETQLAFDRLVRDYPVVRLLVETDELIEYSANEVLDADKILGR